MRYFIAAVILLAAPVHAAGLSDPVVTPEIVVAEAEAGSASVDGLLVALWLATVFAAAGGAF